MQDARGDVAFKVVESPREREDAVRVRWDVFVHEQRVPPEEEVDAFDADAATTHFVGYAGDGTAVAAARLRVIAPGEGKVERVAIARALRGTGAGRSLMRVVEAEARARGCRRLKLDAQLQAEGFYQRLGYARVSDEVFLDAGIEHVAMAKET